MNESVSQDCAACPFYTGAIEAIFSEGEQVVDEGKPIVGVHCIRWGRVGLVKRGDEDYPDWIVSIANSGDVVGIPDIFDGSTYQNGALALEETAACFIPRDEAIVLLKNDPSIMFRIMQRVCNRIRTMERSVELVE